MFELTDSIIQPSVASARLNSGAAGALVTFEGWVRNRNEGRDVTELEYEAYPEMALREGTRILEESREAFDVLGALCIHRTGRLAVGDIAVWIGVASVHRGPAYDACEYIIDHIKVRVPIWKKEFYSDGDSGWVACHECAHALDGHQH